MWRERVHSGRRVPGHREARAQCSGLRCYCCRLSEVPFPNYPLLSHPWAFLCRYCSLLKDSSIPSVPGEVLLENLTEASHCLPSIWIIVNCIFCYLVINNYRWFSPFLRIYKITQSTKYWTIAPRESMFISHIDFNLFLNATHSGRFYFFILQKRKWGTEVLSDLPEANP